MSRTEVYHKVAADYDSMARVINDPEIQAMYVEFAQQWRAAAEKRAKEREPSSTHPVPEGS